jgi:arsenate reductase
MILFLYSKCSTCQKALKFLENKKISPIIKDIVNCPPTIDELKQMFHFQNNTITKLLNTSGLLYREMQLSKKIREMSPDEIFTLLSHHGMLVKRPFLLADDFGLTGFNEAEWMLKF